MRPAPSAEGADRRVRLGVIVGPHGVRGAVRVKSFTEDPRAVAAYGALEDATGDRRFRLTVERVAKGVPIVSIDGVNDRDGAEGLKGTELFVARDRLPDAADGDEFYHADLIGLAVLDRDGRRLGRVRALHDFGAGDLIEFAPDGGGTPRVLPFTREAVPDIDLAAGTVTVDPPEGL